MALFPTHVIYFVYLVLLLAPVSLGQDCQIVVPADPLTAIGLSTPYFVSAVDPKVDCTQANVGTFVQGGVVDLATGLVSIYNPLVIDAGTTPATPPIVPTLPVNYVAALWFGTNGGSLTLVGTGNSLASGGCVNGVAGSIFGQVAYCNAPAFFLAMKAFVATGQIPVPALTKALDGQPCPTTHDFFIVDQDQSDNVVTTYLLTKSGKIAQNTALNRKKFTNSTVLTNGSDERLITLVNAGLGCPDFTAPDLADPNSNIPSLHMNELFASVRQAKPVAFVPNNDPMVVLANGNANLAKLNLYRLGMNQPLLTAATAADPTKYCQHIANVFPTRMMNPTTQTLLSKQPSPDPAMGTNLYLFLGQRFVASFQNLNCQALLGLPVCMTMKTKNGVALDMAIDATLIPPPVDDDSNAGTHAHVSWAVLAVPLVMTWAMLAI